MSHRILPWHKKLFGFSALVLLAGILIATLWPFEFHPENDVRWVAGGNGLEFGRHGIVLSAGPLRPDESRENFSCSLELLLKPASIGGVATFLVAYRDDQKGLFELRQYQDGIIVARDPTMIDAANGAVKKDVDHFFHLGRTVLLTLTSGQKGTAVYSDGRFLERFLNFSLPCRVLGGRLTLGTSPLHIEPWRGEFRGLALYERELGEREVLGHSLIWSQAEKNFEPETTPSALFLFDEHSGTVAHNLVPGGTNLFILPYFALPLKPFLSPPWREFEPSWAYVDDLVRNILGFLPFGFALCGYLSSGRWKSRAVVSTVLAGALTSFGIEILQGFIPQRESGMTDVLTNTTGAALGAFLFLWFRDKGWFGAVAPDRDC